MYLDIGCSESHKRTCHYYDVKILNSDTRHFPANPRDVLCRYASEFAQNPKYNNPTKICIRFHQPERLDNISDYKERSSGKSTMIESPSSVTVLIFECYTHQKGCNRLNPLLYPKVLALGMLLQVSIFEDEQRLYPSHGCLALKSRRAILRTRRQSI